MTGSDRPAGGARRVRTAGAAARSPSAWSRALLASARGIELEHAQGHAPVVEPVPSTAGTSSGAAAARRHSGVTLASLHPALPSPPLNPSQLDMLRQKRNMLRARSEDVGAWAGAAGANGGHQLSFGARQSSDAASLAAAQRRRAAYTLSSSSSSDSEEAAPGDGGQHPAAPSEQELTAKLFAKLGIKQGGHGRGAAGFESDSSWASSPERSRLIKAGAAGGGSTSGGAATPCSKGDERAEVERARGTIAALQQQLAAARAQADGTTQQLRTAQEYAARLEVRRGCEASVLHSCRGTC